MKTLSNYISEKLIMCSKHVSEKLIINKNFKCIDYNLPNNEGVCIYISYPNPNDVTMIKKLNIIKCNYHKEKNGPVYTQNEKLNKSNEGIYYNIVKDKWIELYFFNETAKEIIKNIKKDPHMKFDFNDYVPSLNNKPINFNTVYTFSSDDKTPYYSSKYLNSLLSSIK